MIGMPDSANGGQLLAVRLQPYLRPGEDLLWCGRPDPTVIFNRADVVAIPFSLVWLGIALAFHKGVGATGAPQPFGLLGDVLVVFGIYLVAGRFVTRWLGKRKAVYGITTDRVLVQAGSSFRDSPVKGGSMSIRRGPRGRHATVVFEPFGSYVVDIGGPVTRRRVAPGQITFADVSDADAMLAAINQAKSVLQAGQTLDDPAGD